MLETGLSFFFFFSAALSLLHLPNFFILLAFLHFCLLGSPTDKADLARSSFCPAFPFTSPRPCVLSYSSQLEPKSKSSLESFVKSQSQVINYICVAGGYVHSEIFPQLWIHELIGKQDLFCIQLRFLSLFTIWSMQLHFSFMLYVVKCLHIRNFGALYLCWFCFLFFYKKIKKTLFYSALVTYTYYVITVNYS